MKYTYDSVTATTKPQLVIKREHLQALDWLVWGILDPGTVHPTQRERYEATARAAALEIKNLMCDQEFGAAGRELRLIPMSLSCKDYHQDRVEEAMLDIGEHKVNPITALLARQQAKDVDDQTKSDDFRIAGLEVLEELLYDAWRQGKEYDDEAEAEADQIPDETIELGYNYHAAPQ